MMSLAIDNTARDSMMQLTGQNWFTRSLSGGYKMTYGSRVRKLFIKNRRSSKHEDGESMGMPNEFYKSSAMPDVLFISLPHF